MEELFVIEANISGAESVKGQNCDVTMVSFGGTAHGKYFSGKVIGCGVDTQKSSGGKCLLSARYMLEGKDICGEVHRVFIENNGSFENGFVPEIVTDSKALGDLVNGPLKAEVSGSGNSVTIRIFRL